MKISYDSKVDALYVRFTDKQVQVTTQRLSEDISVNYGPSGDVVGIEVLSAHAHLRFVGKRPQIKTENLTVLR